jgi:hypothetical protein
VFGPRFGKNIANSFQNFFKCLPEEQVLKLLKIQIFFFGESLSCIRVHNKVYKRYTNHINDRFIQ